MALRLLGDRPPFRKLDLRSARFVVARGTITVNGRKLYLGEEVPRGALRPYALECEYERPLARIDELKYALTVDGLREACEAHGVRPDAAPVEDKPDLEAHGIRPDAAPVEDRPDLEALDRVGMIRLCERSGLATGGTNRQLRQRLDAYLAQEH